MKITESSTVANWSIRMTLAVLLGLLLTQPDRVQAQDNGVYNSGNTVVGSPAFFDATTFAGNDICAKINAALRSSIPSTGGVVDARGVVPNGPPSTPQYCGSNPFTNVTVPSTVLLPASSIHIQTKWTLPDRTRVVGEGGGTILVACTAMDPNCNNIDFNGSEMVDMGYLSSGNCVGSQTAVCTGVSIEHLGLDVTKHYINGIVNAYSQDLSYVDDVSISHVGLTGFVISAPNSGPYSRLQYIPVACNGSQCPACVNIGAQTRGLHGITCTGEQSVSNVSTAPGHAAIYVQASNNSIDDVHIEGFWDGIQIGNPNSQVSNVVISNVTGGFGGSGPVTNTIHICGPNSKENVGSCSGGSVSDVTILQVSGDVRGHANCTATILDDVTGTAIGPATITGGNWFVGMYSLGESVPVSSTAQFSLFATSPGVSLNTSNCSVGTASYNLALTTLPTWSVGGTPQNNATCSTPGALYSNTAGMSNSNNSVYVCTEGGTWQPIV
jgi:hypothetical protein